jgi:uncharacterized membrane protein YbaN (DUF454 family)
MQNSDEHSVASSLKKGVYFIVGVLALGAGIIGVFLPVLPTTPFILLSAWCFFRSSTRFYEWIISNERFGPTIQNYQEGRGITKPTKIRAIVMMWLAITVSVYFFITNIYLIALMYTVAVGVTVYLYRLPTLELKKGSIETREP